MDELIAQVSQRTGLSPEQAKAAAEAVLDHFRSRLPAPLASHLDQILGSNSKTAAPADAGIAGLAEKVSGLFGR